MFTGDKMLQWHRYGVATSKAFSLVLFLKRNLGLTIKTNTLREIIIFHAINRKMPSKHKRFPSCTC